MPSVDAPRSKAGFALGDYVEVKDRIKMFYAAFPDGRLVTDSAWVSVDDDVPRVWVRAYAYRTADDPHPGVGHSWMPLPGLTPYTRGSELENTETSAWGRAIGSLGIALDRSIASADEVRNKDGADRRPGDGLLYPPDRPELERRAEGLIGVVTRGAEPADLGLRYEPDGTAYWGFKLKAGKTGYQAFATGQLAEALNTATLMSEPTLEGQNATVWGKVEMVPWRKGDREMPPYARIIIEKMQTADWTLPVEPLTAPMFAEEEVLA